MKKSAVVILSCDKYSDLWEVMSTSIVNNFEELGIPIYLVSNEITFNYPGIINIQTGVDEDWSTSLISAISQIPQDSLLLFLDDMPLLSKPNYKKIIDCFQLVQNKSIGMIQPRSIRRIQRYHIDRDFWYEFSKHDSYTANVFGFWDKETLLKILKPGESPWKFEIYGSQRLNSIAKSGAIKDEIFDYAHLVQKGMWVTNVSDLLRLHNLKISLISRETNNTNASLNYIKEFIFQFTLNCLPRKIQPFVFRLYNKLAQI